MVYAFAHHGRFGADTMALYVGKPGTGSAVDCGFAPGSVPTTLGTYTDSCALPPTPHHTLPVAPLK